MKLNFFNSGIIFLTTLLTINMAQSQEIIASLSKDGTIAIDPGKEGNTIKKFTVMFKNNKNESKPFTCDIGSGFEADKKKTYLEKDDMAFSFDKEGKVLFANHKKTDRSVFYCDACKCFALEKCPDTQEQIEKKDIANKSGSLPPDFPFPPQLSPKSDSNRGLFPDAPHGYYHLVIDADANITSKKNNTLYLKKLNSETATYKIAKWLKVNSSLSFFISNYNFGALEDINISVNGKDYHYEQGIGNIYSSVLPDSQGLGKKGDSIKGAATNGVKDIDTSQVISSQLYWALNDYLIKFTSLNINDMVLLNQYKVNLRKFYTDHSDKFNKEAIMLLNQILVWNPQLVSLSPIAITIPDSDEIEFELRIREKNGAEKKYNVGTYYVRGKASVIAGVKGSLFFTNLKNNEAYIDSADHKAKLDDKHQVSVGIGASGIVSFRTGTAWTPTINLGFFVPLGEDLSPFGHFGPGINFGTQKVGLNLSAGLAFGKVNEIKTRYQDIDMRTIQNPDPTGITDKVWKMGWSVSLGLSFNISK